MSNIEQPFWEVKKITEMSEEEWESLCDGCGRCCLIKLEDEDTNELYHTRLSCHLLDIGKCSCSNYEKRHEIVPDCINLTPDKLDDIFWLPKTCGYRLIHEGKELSWWHPLISGNKESVHEAGISIRSFAMSETKAAGDAYYKYVIHDDMHLDDG